MPLLGLGVDDARGPGSRHALSERNAFALLSGDTESALDPPFPVGLADRGNREPVRRSGLWNNHRADEGYDPPFLDALEVRVDKTRPP